MGRPNLSADQEKQVLRAACRRVTAAVLRQKADSTRVILDDAAEMPVYGAFVTLKRAGQLRSCCGFIQSVTPLYQALDFAADRAATDDPRFPPIEQAELSRLHVDVWILWDPQPVIEHGEDRIAAVTIGKHGLLIERGGNRGLLLPGVAVEHHFDAKTFLQQVCIKAGLPVDAWKSDDTNLQVFEGLAIEGPMQVERQDARQPAVAGGFYPGSPREVKEAVHELFEGITPSPQPWVGAIVPHAGWIYSGRIAASVYSRIAFPDCAIVLCPKHRAPGANWAVAPHRRWLFPGGELPSDPELAETLAETISGLELDSMAHRDEHAIEVQLPLLAHMAPNLRVVGIVVGDSSLPELLRFGVALSVVVRDMPKRPLLIVSSDMNHFADDVQTRRLDHLALDAIATLDPERVYETVRKNRISMCGMAPCVAVMEALRWLNSLSQCEMVGYATSADAGAGTDRVVGYAGVLLK